MRLFSNSDFEALSWYRKITRVVLTPFVILLIAPAVLLIFGVIGVFAAVSNYLGETKFSLRMRKQGRCISRQDVVRNLTEGSDGTLIIESPTLGWAISRAWWTHENVVAVAPVSAPSEEQYRKLSESKTASDWDIWCWNKYTSPNNGKALLVRVWNGESEVKRLRKKIPSINVVETWTGIALYRLQQAEAERNKSTQDRE